ncbi:hypothetical protein Tco_0986695 [Tanacetum coccineum]
MAAPKAGNQLVRRVIDDLVDFSKAQSSRNLLGQLNALIAEMEAFEYSGEVFDTLMGLRDDRRVKQTKLMGLNKLITQAEEEVEMKEAQVEAMNGVGNAVRAFENIKEIVARDFVMLGDLEQLLARAQVGVCLKDGYLADVEEKG